jgi:CRP-like cAMP-binding protein
VNSHRAKVSAYLADAVALFASMTEDEKEALASTMARRTFRKGEILAEQGAVLKSLIIVRSGVAAVVRSDGVRETELGRLLVTFSANAAF